MGTIKYALFINLMISVYCFADVDSDSKFYKEYRKLKNPTREQIDAIKARTTNPSRAEMIQKNAEKAQQESQKRAAQTEAKTNAEEAAYQKAHPNEKDSPDRDEPMQQPSSSTIAVPASKKGANSISVPSASGPKAPGRLNLKEEDVPQEMHFPEATPTPKRHP